MKRLRKTGRNRLTYEEKLELRSEARAQPWKSALHFAARWGVDISVVHFHIKHEPQPDLGPEAEPLPTFRPLIHQPQLNRTQPNEGDSR